MNKFIFPVIWLLIWLIVWYIIPREPVDYNSSLMYGNSGSPKNCRAIITENIKAYKNNEFSADDIMASIYRNCGANGYSWEIE